MRQPRLARRPRREDPAPTRGAGSRQPPAPEVVGVDTGGTFTDFVARAGSRWVTWKEPSTPAAPERAVLEGLARLGAVRATRVRHGSTVATNALLERKGARVALLATAGFEDLIEIGRQDRPRIYDLAPRRVEPLVPPSRRIGVAERIGPGGVVLEPLARAEIARAVRAVRRSGAESVAVGLLHAYARGGHERALARALQRLGLPVTCSAELCPEFREFERLATTVANAYLGPRVARYLESLAAAHGPRLEIVLSHGGTAPARDAAREPVRQLLSGPAAGLEAAWDAARACGFDRALTLDVGGTSTDVAYAEGSLPRRRGREVAGFPIQLPLLDVHTVGAGGGSIARVDAGGLLAVGPESAGADPGPASYARGGPATVTDALIVLGRLPAMALGGGAVTLDPAAAERAMRGIGRALDGRNAVAAAAAVERLAEARMEAALRAVSVERGHDPRGAALVSFGGAGGLHACALAGALGCAAVVFPAHAGVLSALGAMAGPPRRERSRSVMLDARDRRGIARALVRLEREVRGAFPRAARPRVRLERFAEARYRGQSHELTIEAAGDLAERVHRAHEARYGFADRAQAVEVVTLEVRGTGPAPPRLRALAGPRGRAWPLRHARVFDGGRWRRAAVWDASALPAAWHARGPAIVLQPGATLWVPGRWRLRRHPSGAIVVTPGARR
jgi:N-methylhydantoinase A